MRKIMDTKMRKIHELKKSWIPPGIYYIMKTDRQKCRMKAEMAADGIWRSRMAPEWRKN